MLSLTADVVVVIVDGVAVVPPSTATDLGVLVGTDAGLPAEGGFLVMVISLLR